MFKKYLTCLNICPNIIKMDEYKKFLGRNSSKQYNHLYKLKKKIKFEKRKSDLKETEFFENKDSISMIEELSRSNLLFGVRLAIGNKELFDYLNNNLFINLDIVAFSYNDVNELDNFTFSNRDYKIFIETVDININDKLEIGRASCRERV